MIDIPIHQAVSVCTEVDVPIWIYGKQPCSGKPAATRVQRITPQAQYPTRKGGPLLNALLGITPRAGATMIEFLQGEGLRRRD